MKSYGDWVVCGVCGKRFKQITESHLRKHGLNMFEYRIRFPFSSLKSKDAVAFLGEKRPDHAEKLRKKKVSKTCRGCGKKFYVLPHRSRQRYCSPECYITLANPMNNPLSIRRLSDTQKSRYQKNPDLRSKQSKIQKELWSNPDYKERVLKRMFEGLKRRPTSIEKSFINFIDVHGLSFKYVGDGRTFIGRKVPDFIDFNNKMIIELFGDYWHKPEEEATRKKHFARYGYRTLVIWEHELKTLTEEDLLAKILDWQAFYIVSALVV